jgi:Big-like domain-containing protein
MGTRLAGRLASVALVAATVLFTQAPPALAAPPTCGTPTPQTVITGDTLVYDPAEVCSDPDADILSYEVTTDPQHGTVELVPFPFIYTPTPPYTGPDSFSFTASAGTDTTSAVTVEITVVENQPPVCPATISLSAEPDLPTTFDPYFDCTDDQEEFLFDIVTPPQHGTLTDYSFFDGFIYEPAMGYRGPDTIVIQANDGVNQSDPMTVDVTVLQPNRVPQCVTPVTVRIPAGGSAVLDYRMTCSDPDGDPLSPQLVTGPAHGTLEFAPLPAVTYRPAAGFQGADLVRYLVRDDRGGESNVATVNLIVGTVVASSPPDRTAPVPDLAKGGSLKLKNVRKNGLRLKVVCNEGGTMRIAATVSKATARKLRINRKAKGPVVIGRTSKAVTPGENAITLRLTRNAKRGLARARSAKVLITINVVDAAGNAGTDTLSLTLRR